MPIDMLYKIVGVVLIYVFRNCIFKLIFFEATYIQITYSILTVGPYRIKWGFIIPEKWQNKIRLLKYFNSQINEIY